ncbi:MAG: S8 family serine peptidase, partial [Verrucomicrobiota bacterium]
MTKARITLLAVLCMLLLLPSTGGTPGGPPSGPAFVPGEVLLKFKPGAQASGKIQLAQALGATTLHTFHSQAVQWRLGPNVDVQAAIARLQADPSVQYAEPNYIVKLNVVPNDPRLGELWGMINTGQSGGTPDADIDADLAWGVSTGSPNVIVADIDTGLDYNHPDIAANVWTNP